jgi:hypothetical protein
MASISELVGVAKKASDLSARKVKIRYQVSNSVPSSGYFRQTFPKIATDLLSCDSIKLRFMMNINSTDADTCVDAPDIRSIFNRCRVLSGSTVLVDTQELSQLFTLETLINTSSHDSPYERYLTGNESLEERKAYPAKREYICSIAPQGSLLNTNALLPLYAMSDLHLELWLETPARCLYSAGDPTPDFNISEIELLTTYVRSPSVEQYFRSNPLSFHITDYSHRYNNVLNQQNLIRLSSSHSSLNKVLTVLKAQASTSAVDEPGKMTSFHSGELIKSHNVFLNNTLLYEEDVDSRPESWQHFRTAFPAVHSSEFFDARYNTDRNVIAVDVQACPRFHTAITSGVSTSSMNSDTVIRLNLTSAPNWPLRSDSYLMSDALVYLDSARGDLKIKY